MTPTTGEEGPLWQVCFPDGQQGVALCTAAMVLLWIRQSCPAPGIHIAGLCYSPEDMIAAFEELGGAEVVVAELGIDQPC